MSPVHRKGVAMTRRPIDQWEELSNEREEPMFAHDLFSTMAWWLFLLAVVLVLALIVLFG